MSWEDEDIREADVAPSSKAREVTEAMVDAAIGETCEAASRHVIGDLHDASNCRQCIRAILTAALRREDHE